MTAKSAPPLVRPVNVTALPVKGRTEKIVADDSERAAIAAVHDLASVDRFVADLTVRRWKRDGVRVTGLVHADIVQNCVLSLEPFAVHVEAPIDAVFFPETSSLARRIHPAEGHDIVIDPEGPDAPETFVPPHLDLGAVAEEFFVLALDPHPRKPGAAAAAMPADSNPDDDASSPFAALDRLRRPS